MPSFRIISLSLFLSILLPLSASAATLYYNNDRGDGDWSNLENWWTNAGFTSEASTLPTATDDVIISADLITNTGDPITVNSATFTGTAQNQILLTVTTLATFADQSINYQGEILGDALFSGTAINYGTTTSATFTNSSNNQGTTTATATFQDTTVNAGYIGTDASFAGSSYNVGTVAGNAVFIGNDAFNDNVIIGNATFTGTAYSFDPTYSSGISSGNITFTENVTFTLTDEEWFGFVWTFEGTSALILNGASVFDGSSSFRGDVTFNDTSYAEPGAVLWSGDVTLTAASYPRDPLNNLSSMMGGTITFTQSDVAFTLSGTSVWRSNTTDWVLPGTPTWVFNDASRNEGYVPTATFTAATYGYDPMSGGSADSVTFTQPDVAFTLSSTSPSPWDSDTSTWTLPGTPTWEFNDNSSNSGTGVILNAIFNDASWNAGIVTGDAVFNNTSSNQNTVTGAATFTGTAYTYDPMSGGTASSVTFTQPVVFTLMDSFWGSDVSTWTFEGAKSWIFNSEDIGTSGNMGTIYNAVFNDYSFNSGTVIDDAAFYDHSYNHGVGVVGNDATFNDTSYNSGAVTGTATFTRTAYTSDPTGIYDYGAVIGSVVFSNNVVFTITSGEWYADSSTWTFEGTKNWIFNGESYNYGNVPVATFNDTSFNSSIVTGAATFTNTSYISDPTGISSGATIGSVIFTNPVIFTLSYGTWAADTSTWDFQGGADWVLTLLAINSGTLKGDADVYFPAPNPIGGTVTGTVTYHDYPAATYCFNDANGSSDWNDVNNWWDSSGCTGNHAKPGPTDQVVVVASVYSNSGDPAVVATSTFYANASIGVPLTVTQAAIFNDQSWNGSTLTGTTTFNEYSSNGGDLVGDATFNGLSVNSGNIDGNATFNNSSYNSGTVTGAATFNNSSRNLMGVVTNAVFNGSSINSGTVNEDAVFNGSSFNDGWFVYGTATFTGTAYSLDPIGAGYAESVIFTNPVVFTLGQLDGYTIWVADTTLWDFQGGATWIFDDEGRNNGVIPAATFNDTSYNSGTVTGAATFTGAAYTFNPVGNAGSVTFTNPVAFTFSWGVGVDNSTWDLQGGATWNFIGNGRNLGSITGDVTFSGNSANDDDDGGMSTGAVIGNAAFVGNSDNSFGTVTGAADCYFYPGRTLTYEAGITGAITYHEPFYFSGTDGDWSNLENWWRNEALTEAAATLPDATKDLVFLYASTTLPSNYANNLYIRANDVVVDGGGYTIGGNVSGNGVNDGDDGFDFTLQNVTVSGVVGSAGHSSVTNGGAGGDITIIDTTIVSSGYSISVGGGSSTGCGNGGAGGSIVSTNSTYTDAYSDPGSASTATCPRVGGRGIRPPAPVVPPSTPNPLGSRSRSVVTPPAPNTPGTNIPRNTLRTLELTLAKLLAPLKLQDLPFFTTPISPNQGVTVLPNPLAGLRSPGELKLENLAALPNFSQHFSANLMSLIALKAPSATSTPSLPIITPPPNPPPPAPRSIWSWLKNIF